MTMIAIDRIRADIQAQPRSSIMMDTVSDYIERMSEGDLGVRREALRPDVYGMEPLREPEAAE